MTIAAPGDLPETLTRDILTIIGLDELPPAGSARAVRARRSTTARDRRPAAAAAAAAPAIGPSRGRRNAYAIAGIASLCSIGVAGIVLLGTDAERVPAGTVASVPETTSPPAPLTPDMSEPDPGPVARVESADVAAATPPVDLETGAAANVPPRANTPLPCRNAAPSTQRAGRGKVSPALKAKPEIASVRPAELASGDTTVTFSTNGTGRTASNTVAPTVLGSSTLAEPQSGAEQSAAADDAARRARLDSLDEIRALRRQW